MRLPRVPFTVRRMMVVVAILTIMTGLADLGRRREVYRLRADEYGEREAQRLGEIKRLELRWKDELDDLETEMIGWNRRAADYLALSRTKYLRLASRPWVVASPDPPEPDYVWKAESGLR